MVEKATNSHYQQLAYSPLGNKVAGCRRQQWRRNLCLDSWIGTGR
jgi:hypothetical protein